MTLSELSGFNPVLLVDEKNSWLRHTTETFKSSPWKKVDAILEFIDRQKRSLEEKTPVIAVTYLTSA